MSDEMPRLLWVVMITSRENRGWPGDIEIQDIKSAGLPAPSIVRTAKIATIEANTAEKLGSLPPRNALKSLQNCDDPFGKRGFNAACFWGETVSFEFHGG